MAHGAMIKAWSISSIQRVSLRCSILRAYKAYSILSKMNTIALKLQLGFKLPKYIHHKHSIGITERQDTTARRKDSLKSLK